MTDLVFSQAIPALTSEQMTALLKSRPELDEIRWKDPARGAPLKVRIVSATPQSVVVEKTLPAGLTTRTVPMSELSGIEFSLTPREQAMHRQPQPAAIGALKVLWESRLATMRVAGSNVADTGLALAKSLRLAGEISSLEEAGEILDHIVSQDTSDHRKEIARGEQSTIAFSRSLKIGTPAERDTLAWQITEDLPDHSDAMLLATAYLADRHFSDLKAIEEKNPRWMEDDEVKPQRERLYHLALDFSLYPSLFLGTRQMESAEGLKKAAAIYQFANRHELAKGALEDLTVLYPETEAAKESAPLLAELKKAEATGELAKMISDPEPEESEDEKKELSPASTPPPPPKRYNIFGD